MARAWVEGGEKMAGNCSVCWGGCKHCTGNKDTCPSHICDFEDPEDKAYTGFAIGCAIFVILLIVSNIVYVWLSDHTAADWWRAFMEG